MGLLSHGSCDRGHQKTDTGWMFLAQLRPPWDISQHLCVAYAIAFASSQSERPQRRVPQGTSQEPAGDRCYCAHTAGLLRGQLLGLVLRLQSLWPRSLVLLATPS